MDLYGSDQLSGASIVSAGRTRLWGRVALFAGLTVLIGAFALLSLSWPSAARAAAASQSQQPSGSPISSTFFGLHINLLSTPWPQVPFGSLRLLADLTTWVHLEGQSRNQYDWRMLDGWLSQARAHGVDAMYSFVNTPPWAATDPHGNCGHGGKTGECTPPKDLSLTAPCQGPLAGVTTTDCYFKEYVTSLLDHVCTGTAPNKNCQITAFSCWNEPNLDGFWSGTYAQSAQMCSDMVKIVKEQCRNCITLTPDVSAATTGGTKENGDSRSWDEWGKNFLLAYKQYGNYPDAAAFHPYAAQTFGLERTPFPDTLAGSSCPGGARSDRCPGTILERVVQFRSLLDQYGMPGKAIWDTESSWGPQSGLSDPDLQAAFVARWLIVQASAGVARAYWFLWEHAGRGWGGLWHDQNGITNAGTAWGQVYNWLAGATFVKPCSANADVWVCDLSRPNGYMAEIVWDASHSYLPEATSKYAVGKQFTQYRDLAGNKNPVRGGNVMISTKPILLENAAPPPTHRQ